MSVEVPVMRIVINGHEGIASAEPGARMGSVVDEVRQWLLSNRVAILEMRLDGGPYDAMRQNATRLEPAEAHELLEIQAAPIPDLSRDVLSSIREHLPRISERLVEITSKLQAGDSAAAFPLLDDVLEAWGLVLKAFDNLRRLYGAIDLHVERIDSVVAGKEASLRRLLEEIHSALKDHDLVTVGDCLEYELSPMVGEWIEVVEALEESLARIPEDPPA